MGRDDGFAIADVASDHFDDEKVRRLWRLLSPDHAAMCEAMTLRFATLLESWGEGRRVTVDEAAPLWLPLNEDLVGALIGSGLLDRSRRVPARSWTSWFDPAVARRDLRREAGRLGGLAKAKRPSSGATAPLQASPKRRSTRPAVRPDRPSVRPDKPSSPPRSPAGPAGGDRGGPSFREALAAEGFPPPTKGGAS